MKRYINNLLTFFIIIVLLIGCSQVGNTTPEVEDINSEEVVAFQNKVDDLLSKRNFTGTVLLAKDGAIYFSKGYGLADEENNIPNERDTIYLMGSLTKAFTSMAIMQLKEAGKLSVDDTIDKYFPGYSSADEITIHHLLTHTSGFNNELKIDISDMQGLNNKDGILQTIEKHRDEPLISEPGTEFLYSNPGYTLLGAIIEAVSGITYGEYISEYIAKPLGLNDTGYNIQGTLLERQAKDFSWNSEESINPSIAYAGGGLHTTVDDLYRWDRAIRNNTLVNEETTKEMLTPFKNGYGYGWFIVSENVYEHSGSINGYRAFISSNAEDDITVIVLSNHTSSFEVKRVVDILKSYMGEL